MPKINVYLPQWLADALRQTDIAVSETCQQALAKAVGRKAPVTNPTVPERSRDWLQQSAEERAADLERAAAAIRYGLAPGTTVPAIIKPIGAATALGVIKSADASLLQWEHHAQNLAGHAAALEVVNDLGAHKAVIELIETKHSEAKRQLDEIKVTDRFGPPDQILDLLAELQERAHPRPPK